MNTSNRIDFNFTYFALKALGNSLYSNPWVAISELVANGLDAGAGQVKVLIDLRQTNSATIEILDNGSGMSYDELAYKYAIIGRNKREDTADKSQFGRKGVGKLASLYLTNHYYISTKDSNEETLWEIDTSRYKDSDVPGLEKIDKSSIEFVAKKEWSAFKTGTLIKLVNVNLKSVGDNKINSLKTILSDYYKSEIFNDIISVAIVKEDNAIVFENLTKEIYFDAFYAMFDNTGKHVSEMKKAIYMTDEDEVFPEVDYPRETKIIKEELPCKGTMKMFNNDGELVSVDYKMEGWIGINGSLIEDRQKRNSPNYKKHVYRGNQLRLYVRGKLAVSDVMKFLNNNQVGANYIEGEISFDVLDRNDLADTATTNRESYKLDDPRVQKLFEILRPIVGNLINERSKIGTYIKKQIEEIEIARQKQLENEKKSSEELKSTLEKVENDKKKIEKQNFVANKRLLVLEKNFIGSGENYKNGMHLAVNYAKAIKANSMKLSKDIDKSEYVHIIDIAAYAENIIRLNKLLGKAKFNLNSKIIHEDLFQFIKDYVKVVSTSSLEVFCDFSDIKYIVEFEFCEMSMVIENIISNAKKSKSKKLIISAEIENGKNVLYFKDDGDGLHPSIENSQDIFKLGYSKTGGTGIGGYLIYKSFNKLSNDISIQNNLNSKGINIRVILNEQI